MTDQRLSKKKKRNSVSITKINYVRGKCADLNKISQIKPSPSTKLIGSMALAVIFVISVSVFSSIKLVDHLMYCLAVKLPGMIVVMWFKL